MKNRLSTEAGPMDSCGGGGQLSLSKEPFRKARWCRDHHQERRAQQRHVVKDINQQHFSENQVRSQNEQALYNVWLYDKQ